MEGATEEAATATAEAARAEMEGVADAAADAEAGMEATALKMTVDAAAVEAAAPFGWVTGCYTAS